MAGQRAIDKKPYLKVTISDAGVSRARIDPVAIRAKRKAVKEAKAAAPVVDADALIKAASLARKARQKEEAKAERARRKRRLLGVDDAGRAGVELISTYEDDPGGGKVRVQKNVRADPVELLLSRKVINEVQAEAAERAMMIMERMEIGGAGAIDYSRTRVDGGKLGDPITDQVLEAAQAMKDIDWKCGPMGAMFLRDALCLGLSLTEIALIRCDGGRSAIGYVTYRIREALDALVDCWHMGEAQGRKSRKIVASQDMVTGPQREWVISPVTGDMVEKKTLRA